MIPNKETIHLMSRPITFAVLSPVLDMNYYYVGILAGIHEFARQHGVRVVSIKAASPGQIGPPSLAWDQADGWLAIMRGEGLERIARDVPLVTIGGAHLPHLGCPTVMPNNVGGTDLLVSHLIEHGHRHIAFVGDLENADIRERYDGYRRALSRHDIPFNPWLVFRTSGQQSAKLSGEQGVKHLISTGQPCSAIVASTDMIAIGALGALQAAGLRVPDDVALVGFDDLYVARYTTPALTTIRHPFESLGRTASALLLDQIAGNPVPSGVTYVDTVPVWRRSCGCMPSHTAIATTPTTHAPRTRWREQIYHRLLDTIRRNEPQTTTTAPLEAEVERLVHAIGDAFEASVASPLALERAWNEIVESVIDLGTLQQLHEVLEQAGGEYVVHAAADGRRVEDILTRSYVEMMRAYRARTIGRTTQIQQMIETNYAISTEISVWSSIGTGKGQRLAWLRHTTSRWGYLARWHDREQGQHSTIMITDAYGMDGVRLLPVGASFPAATFPPETLLDDGTAEQHDIIAMVPFQTQSRDWWILALCFKLETEFLTDRENLGMWTTLLSASLEREALLTSITEQQKHLRVVNQELHTAKDRAERADALKTRLLANVSHELRTPLDIMLGYGEAALQTPNPYDEPVPPRLRDDITQIVRHGNHLVRMIDDLLDLSRAEADALELLRERIAPRALLEDVFHTFARHREATGVEWRLDLARTLPAIDADPTRLRQILLNLLSNARKFTDQGHIALGAAVSPPHLHLWVEDTGMGIPLDLQAHIFEPFVTGNQTTQRRDGIGLGLSITRRLVMLHGGTLTLESQPSRGTTVHVYLPLHVPTPHIAVPQREVTPAILVIGTTAARNRSVVDLSARMGVPIRAVVPGDDLDALLGSVRPVALYWNDTERDDGAWHLVQRIRSHPLSSHVPMVVGEDATDEAAQGQVNVLLKPASAERMVQTIEQLHAPLAREPILIVDDDADARGVYQRMIGTTFPDHPILLADGGAAALRMLATEKPSLVILDLMMPDVDGFAVLQYLRNTAATRAVPVIILSGQLLTQEHIKRLAHGRVVFQSKHILNGDEALSAIERVMDGTDALPPPTSQLVKHALAYIHQHYTRVLSREEIAAAVGVHGRYLSRIFQQEQGISPWDYLNRYRIKQARILLRTTDASITVVAALVGFDDPSYFGRVFRKQVNCSPREFRDRLDRIPIETTPIV